MRRTVLAILLLAVLLPGTALARIAYLCSMDGRLRSSCCCPAKAKHRDPAPATSMKRAGCCEVATSPARDTPLADTPRIDTAVAPLLAAILPAWAGALPSSRAPIIVPRTRGPPPGPARPLFASHCALLL